MPNDDYASKGQINLYVYNRDYKNTTELPYNEILTLYNKLSTTIKDVDLLNENTKQFCFSYTSLIYLFIKFLSEINVNNKRDITFLFKYIVYFLKEKKGGSITYDKTHYITEIYTGNDIHVYEENNVIIVGAGPVGLYMGILLKKSNPALHVIILESRIDKNNNMRYLKREGSIFLKTKIKITPTFIGNNEKEKIIAKDDILQFIKLTIDDKTDFFIDDDTFDLLFKLINENAVKIKDLEYTLANYAQSIGVLIFHTKDTYTKFINDKTMVIFDATGGHFENIKYSYYVDPVKQFIGDGVNINSLNFINNIPIVSIGDSLYKGDYENGCGIKTSFTICFFISFYFTSIFIIQLNNSSQVVEKITERISPSYTIETAWKDVSKNGVLKIKNIQDKKYMDALLSLQNLLLNPKNLTFDDSTRDFPKEQKIWYIPDKQFNNLIIIINETFPDDSPLWKDAVIRQQKERSYFEHGRGSVSAWFSKKTKGLGGKPRRTKKRKHIKYRKTKGGKYRKTKTMKPKYKRYRKSIN